MPGTVKEITDDTITLEVTGDDDTTETKEIALTDDTVYEKSGGGPGGNGGQPPAKPEGESGSNSKNTANANDNNTDSNSSDGTVYVKGTTSYQESADTSGCSTTTSWSDHEVENPFA